VRPDILVIECALNRQLSAYYCSRGRNSAIVSAPGIIVIVEQPRIQDIVEAFELGARGVVMRASLPLVWKTGIQSILAGQSWVDHRSVLFLLDTIRGFLLRTEVRVLPDFGLTVRETEIASRIAAGRSNKEVGQEFAICERTVKHHLTNIFRKVGVSSRLELAVLVREHIPPQTPMPDRIQVGGQRRPESAGKPELFAVPER
jgi:DNA-binding NarL/FixJ family response regulator